MTLRFSKRLLGLHGSPPETAQLTTFRTKPPWVTASRNRSWLARHQGPVTVRRVIIQPRRFTWKRVVTVTLGTAFGFTAGAWLLSFIVLDPDDDENVQPDVALITKQIKDSAGSDKVETESHQEVDLEASGPSHREDDIENEGEETEEEDDIPDETPEGAWFIPLGLARKLPRTFYSADDPEWQAYLQFAKDQTKRKQLEEELRTMVLEALKANINIRRALGKDIRFIKCWLDVDYPPGPPQEYERLGLEWADEYIALLYRTTSPMNVRRVERALWPDTVTTSALATFRDVFWTQYHRAKKALGWDQSGAAPTYPLQLPLSIQARSNASLSDQQDTGINVTSQASVDGKGEQKPPKVGILSVLPDYPQHDSGISLGITLFKRKLARNWRPAMGTLARGTIVLQGLIEYGGDNATCTIEVAAAYSVLESKWSIVGVGLRRIQERRQHPRGPRRVR